MKLHKFGFDLTFLPSTRRAFQATFNHANMKNISGKLTWSRKSSSFVRAASSLSGTRWAMGSCGVLGRDIHAVAASQACTAIANRFFSACSFAWVAYRKVGIFHNIKTKCYQWIISRVFTKCSQGSQPYEGIKASCKTLLHRRKLFIKHRKGCFFWNLST